MSRETPDIGCAELLKLLANETRLAVVQLLRSGPRQVSEINDEIRIDKTLLSHHLRLLREHGIVEAEREGNVVKYRLCPRVKATRDPHALNLGCCQLVFDLEPNS